MNHSHLVTVTVALTAATASAQQEAGDSAVVQETITEAVSGQDAGTHSFASRLSLDLSLRYTSDYFFRGIVQKTDSFNLQPSIELGFELIDTEDFSLSLLGGSWSNFSGDRADGASGSFSEYWYEHDAYVGVSASIDRLNVGAIYTWYFSPSSDFTEYEDLTISFSFDDSGLWDDEGTFSLNPSMSVAFETRNAAVGPDSGVWLGLGIEPTVDLGESVLGPTTLSFPVNVGLSLDDYYQRADGSSDTFGYAEVGAKLSFDLADSLGSATPTLDVGASYLFLDGALDDLNGGDSGELVFSAGLSWSF
jgi:hypothetical protein